ncbi:hypothetical protein HK097_001166 [Rhizophlyctis rosea]|uniref:Uncharacterized protein n=1 Tax=Rhizophlyctis rosea TaxID=64517 RepID=A0AAD5S4S6_9FUNG|nr:hypothetical protein HK097_001166 [Rhizophlyctis rosea]
METTLMKGEVEDFLKPATTDEEEDPKVDKMVEDNDGEKGEEEDEENEEEDEEDEEEGEEFEVAYQQTIAKFKKPDIGGCLKEHLQKLMRAADKDTAKLILRLCSFLSNLNLLPQLEKRHNNGPYWGFVPERLLGKR